MTLLEAIGASLGIINVVLTARQNIWCWPFGIAMVLVYAWIFWHSKLYADAGLQVVYVFLQIYAWQHWARGGPRDSTLPVTTLSPAQRIMWLAAAAVASVSLGASLNHWTDAAFPFGDASIVCFSLCAQWLMGRKKLESWLIWIAVDVLAVAVYALKDLHITAGLYGVFLILATFGFFSWRRALPRKLAPSPEGSSSASSSRPTADISS